MTTKLIYKKPPHTDKVLVAFPSMNQAESLAEYCVICKCTEAEALENFDFIDANGNHWDSEDYYIPANMQPGNSDY